MENSDIRVVDNVKYVTDIRSDFIIKRFMIRCCGIPNCGFGKLLEKLGFDSNRVVYLKRNKKASYGDIELYYSYDKDNFSDKNKIVLSYYFIKIINDDSKKNYYVSKDYNNKNNVIMSYERYKRKIRTDDKIVSFDVYNDNVDILISNNNGDKIEIRINTQMNDDEIISELENNLDLREAILNIEFDGSMDDKLDKIISKFSIIKWDTIRFKYFNDNVEKYYIYLNKMYDKLDINVIDKNNKEEIFYNLNKSDKVCLNRLKEFINSKYVIVLRNDRYTLRLEFVNSDIINELELRKYLLNLEFPVRIDEVFKNIREISLGDIRGYNEIFLNVKDGYHFTDRMEIKNGVLMEFVMTKDGYEFGYDKDDNFVCENSILGSKYTIHMTGDKITEYNCKCQDGIDNTDDSNRVMYRAIRDAKEGKVRVRKLIDDMLK